MSKSLIRFSADFLTIIMAKKDKKRKKGKKHYGRKAKRYARKAKSKTFRLLKGVALEGPLIMYILERQLYLKGHPIMEKLQYFAADLARGTTGMNYTGSGNVKFSPEYLLLGWGGPLVYKGIQFMVNVIPGQRDSPFAELSKIAGG